MNREIKFRFWGKFGELNEEDDECEMEMLYGNRFCFFESEPINDLFDCRNFQVMQYTGLKDKNGKEIYESDIVTDGVGKFKIVYDLKLAGYQPYCIFRDDPENYCEVIGNIYENPEFTQSSE